jgi:hypothetical protein
MIAVREEMAGAIQKYAEPVTVFPVFHHQVQYLVRLKQSPKRTFLAAHHAI